MATERERGRCSQVQRKSRCGCCRPVIRRGAHDHPAVRFVLGERLVVRADKISTKSDGWTSSGWKGWPGWRIRDRLHAREYLRDTGCRRLRYRLHGCMTPVFCGDCRPAGDPPAAVLAHPVVPLPVRVPGAADPGYGLVDRGNLCRWQAGRQGLGRRQVGGHSPESVPNTRRV